MLNNKVIKFLFFALFMGLSLVQDYVVAQTSSTTFTRRNSPYSRYGMGDLFEGGFVNQQSMGMGTAAAYNNYYDFSSVNPASLGYLRHVVFDVGAYYQHGWLSEQSTGLNARVNDGNLSYFSLAFPITKSWLIEQDTLRRGLPIQWGMNIGFRPHSTVGYYVNVTRNLSDIGDLEYSYTGEGHRYVMNWGNGVRYKNFSLGANLGFLFGQVVNRSTINFLDSTYVYAFDEQTFVSEYARGLVWDLGAEYQFKLSPKEDKEGEVSKRKLPTLLTLGVYGNSGAKLRTDTEQWALRFGTGYGVDTISNVTDIRGTINMAPVFGGGVNIGKRYLWQLGVSYEGQFWSAYRNSQDANILTANSYRLSVGGEYWVSYDPNSNNREKRDFFKRMALRFGGYMGTDPRLMSDDAGNTYQLQQYGITFGLGFPVSTRDFDNQYHPFQTNLSFEWGYLGHPDFIQSHFFNVKLGLALTGDKWFVRPKFR